MRVRGRRDGHHRQTIKDVILSVTRRGTTNNNHRSNTAASGLRLGVLLVGAALLYVILGQPPGSSFPKDYEVLSPTAFQRHETDNDGEDQTDDDQVDRPPKERRQQQTSEVPENTNSQLDQPIKVAYAISLIECTDHHKSGQSSIAGLQDGSLVLRHSIHQNSVRNPQSGSKYDYEMYAIIHEQAKACAPVLEDAGFTVLIKEPPVLTNEIRGKFLRRNIHTEVCCGVDEFVKLYAYHLEHPLVVHLDIDFVFRKPMDAVFDVMLGAKDEATRALVEREDPTQPWPVNVEAMITRDWHSSYGNGRKSGFQAGFWVLKPSEKHFDALLEIIRKGDYVEGFGRDNGWGGLGYGGFIGAKAMQGLIAYYYDVHVPGTWVELNNCRYNAVGAIVHKRGQCLNGKEGCEDCRNTPIESIFSIHYTACRKPWQCIAMSTADPQNHNDRRYSIPVDIVHLDHCMEVLKVWHEHRADLENKLYKLTGDEGIKQAQVGTYNQDVFLGHCRMDQSPGYLRLGGSPETIKRIPELY